MNSHVLIAALPSARLRLLQRCILIKAKHLGWQSQRSILLRGPHGRGRALDATQYCLPAACFPPGRIWVASANATASKASWSCKSQPGAAYLSAHSPHAPCGPRTYLPPVLISSLSLYMTLRAARDNVSHAAVMERLQQAPPSSRRARGGPCNLPAACGRSGVGPARAQRGRRSQNRPTAFLAICCRHLGNLAYSARGLPNTCRAAGRAPGSQGPAEYGHACSRHVSCAQGLLRSDRAPAGSLHSSARAAARQSGAHTAARKAPCMPCATRMQGAAPRTFANSASSRYASRQSMSTPSSARSPARARAGQ